MKSSLAFFTFAVFVSVALTNGDRAPAVAASGGTPALLPAGTTVHIKDFRYTPNPVRLRAGERVTFVNDDDDAHTITAADTTFDSAGLDT
ncbi:MAG: hypothetical protein IAI49_13885, partial [Candidatus Eremiobacteraeota bacterium]|nr:hypothetical protein [Candidatus Eremiobacteraeota bacterium]